jgi:hypothetical protein
MSSQKTRPAATSVADSLAQIEDVAKRADAEVLITLMQDVTGEKPVMWGTMIGFGAYHYRYASGHEGDSFLVGLAPRKAEFSLYINGCQLPGFAPAFEALREGLGKHRMGKGCLYINRLSEIDLGVLRSMVEGSVEALRAEYPANA